MVANLPSLQGLAWAGESEAKLLRSAERGRLRPASLIRRLAHQDSQARAWLQQWHDQSSQPAALLPLLRAVKAGVYDVSAPDLPTTRP